MIRFSALLIVLAATACARDDTKYPSLALRPIESRSDDLPDPDATPVAAAADPALDARIATASATIDRNTGDFTTAAAKAGAAAKMRGAKTEGTDAWLAAQGSLADLEALHGDLLALSSELDRLATDRAQAGSSPYPALDAVQAKAQAAAEVQAARIATVKTMLGTS